ncbi:related to salicylate hydroxylase [Phialocephala subalpina]|uniref:Related to salicylate hydroxylase n=1 Tax=Phialocephala subalpina TaxID=576137 RepID=A0A1L7XJ89_9HELO|nr:related to salicylate hydroxylase [Phialocephala subalpina]
MGSVSTEDKTSIHLIIIGAGLAGLSAAISTKIGNPAHQVTILESVKELAEIGAGLQLTPNATRLFKPWGIYETLVPKATFPQSLTVRRFDGTKILAHEPAFQDQISSRYPAPFWGMHRVDLQRAMAARCEELGVVLRLNSKIVHVDFEDVEVEIEGGEWVKGDVVLCTDGLWSATRAQFLGKPSPAILTGDLAYRIVINTADLTGPDAAELREFVLSQQVNFWVGPGTHVVAYTMRAGTVYNIVLLCPDNLPEGISKTEGDLEEMKGLFVGWDPILRKFLDQVKGVAKWKLMWLDGLSEWCNKEGTFWMAGDCCHPMLPYLAQGANSSLEDGAVLGYLLGKVSQENKKEQLPKAAALYQKLRKERGETIQKETFKQRDDFHMEDGERQRKRDELMTGMLGGELKADFPSRWTCPRVQRWLYGYDAYQEAEEGFKASPF